MIYKLQDIDGNIYETENLKEFCSEYELTNRLLHYTNPKWKDTEKRYQEYHKNFKIVEVLSDYEKETLEEEIEREDSTEYLFKQYHKSLKQLQKLKDENRILRRENRFDDRIEGIVERFHKKILKEIPKSKVQPLIYQENNEELEGAIQLSDIHANEVVENSYNLDIMDKRLNKLFNKAVDIFKLHKITTISILLTGDQINAGYSNHLDKMLMNEKSRAEGLKYLFESLSKVIDGLIQQGFKVKIASVLGNEGRINGMEHMSHVNSIAVNNLDYLLIVLLQARYNDKVIFLNEGNQIDDLVKVNDKYFILTHGHNIKHGSDKVLYDEVLRIKKKWFNKEGIMADYLIGGHIHNLLINSLFARSGSLVGRNDYAETGLNIPDSTASQTIFLVGEEIIPIPIFL